MSSRTTAARAALAALALIVLTPQAVRAAEPIWRLEQPPPPAGVPFKVPLGTPGDLSFWEANRGLLTIDGNSTIRPGIYSWNGQSWHQLATVCGGSGDTSRIAWAGPTEFWVVTSPSAPRFGSGLALCHFKNGQVVDSFSTRPDAVDPFRVMLSAACNGPSDCWFGGVGSQDPLGERVGSFHLHWNGSELISVYGPQGRSVSDMEFQAGSLFESTLIGRSPENRTEAVDLAEPESVPHLLHRYEKGKFVTDPFLPKAISGVPDDGTELLALDSDGKDLWAVGGGAASGPAPAQGTSVPREPLAARLVGNDFQELDLSGAVFGDNDRFGDVAAIPEGDEALATVVPFSERHSINSKATVARIAADGKIVTTRLPAAGAGRGAAARVACPAPGECWMVTWAGWIFHYTDGHSLPLDGDSAFASTIEFRPNEAAEQFVPDRLPVDDSQLFAPPPLESAEEEERKSKVKRLPPLLRKVKSQLKGLTLTVSFTLTRKARVQLLAKRGHSVVARSPQTVFAPGRRSISVGLSRERYPTSLAFKTKVLKVK